MKLDQQTKPSAVDNKLDHDDVTRGLTPKSEVRLIHKYIYLLYIYIYI